MKNVAVAEKELLSTMKFAPYDVLFDFAQRIKRSIDLQKAMILGNSEHGKVIIKFYLQEGSARKTETTVWGVTDDFVILKGNITLPVRAIYDIDF